MSHQEKPITWDWLKTIVPLLVVLLGVAVSLASMQTQVDYHEVRLCAMEARQEKIDATYVEILRQLAEIQRDIQYLRRDLDQQIDQG